MNYGLRMLSIPYVIYILILCAVFLYINISYNVRYKMVKLDEYIIGITNYAI